jgi:hypothetical protein
VDRAVRKKTVKSARSLAPGARVRWRGDSTGDVHHGFPWSQPALSDVVAASPSPSRPRRRLASECYAPCPTDAPSVFHADMNAGAYTVEAPQENEPGTYPATVTVASMHTVNVSLQVSEP